MSRTSIHRVVPNNVYQALINALNPSGTNVFITTADLVAAAFELPTALNYTALSAIDPTTVPNQIYNVLNPQGSKWRPVWLGGADFYPSGIYQSIAGVWDFIGDFPYQASQIQVDAGTDNETFVTPLTLANAAKWNSKENSLTAGTNITIDRTNPLAPVINSSGGSSSLTPFKQNTTLSLTGTTTETLITSILIPANTFQANDWLRWVASINATNNGHSKILKFYFNTTASLSGATQVAQRTLANITTQIVLRNMFFVNSISSQKTLLGTTLNVASDDSSTGGTQATLSINFAVDQYFIISGQLAVGTDTITINGITSNINR
jgi:hypothetical protein